MEELTRSMLVLLHLQFSDVVELVSGPRQDVFEFASVPRRCLSFLHLELLVSGAGLCLGKGYFLLYLFAASLNIADIRLKFLLN